MSAMFKRVFLAVIDFYRAFVSPLKPPTCRFVPTCSAYAREAVEVYGPWRGAYMALKRICRCHPFSKSGYDPVPPKV